MFIQQGTIGLYMRHSASVSKTMYAEYHQYTNTDILGESKVIYHFNNRNGYIYVTKITQINHDTGKYPHIYINPFGRESWPFRLTQDTLGPYNKITSFCLYYTKTLAQKV